MFTVRTITLTKPFFCAVSRVSLPAGTKTWVVVTPDGKRHGAPMRSERLAQNCADRLNGKPVTYDALPSVGF